MIIIKTIFFISLFLIFHTFIGYPLTLYIFDKILKRENETINDYKPRVSIIIPAHNEEKVILNKLNNLMLLNYSKDRYDIIIASDNSTDMTNVIVSDFINSNVGSNVYLYEVKERKGKTNVQNEAVKLAAGEILIFSDSNSMLDKEAINQLTSSFSDESIVYVAGKLSYINSFDNITSSSENDYWSYDLLIRKLESKISTITAGNGALYAIRKSEYIDFNPIKSHDSAMPLAVALNHKRAIYNEKAIAFEKAGETKDDEFLRKVRMNRIILSWIFQDFRKYNVFKYGWFSYFYFCHRTLRYTLFSLQFNVLISNIFLINESSFFTAFFIVQLLFYVIALLGLKIQFKNKIWFYPNYYLLTILAQFLGAIKQLSGKSKPFWEKAESTR